MNLGLGLSLNNRSGAAIAGLPDNAAVFDGTNDYMTQNVTGQGNSYVATANFWGYFPTQASYGTDRVLAVGAAVDAAITVVPGFGVSVQAQNSTSTSNLRLIVNAFDFLNKEPLVLATSDYAIPRDTFVNIFISIDTENFIYKACMNGTDINLVETLSIGVPLEMCTDSGTNAIGRLTSDTPSSMYLNGALYQVWVDLRYWDCDVYGVIFYNLGDPPNLGATGAALTGQQPLIYLNSEPASFTTNAGTSGNFTLVGALGSRAAP